MPNMDTLRWPALALAAALIFAPAAQAQTLEERLTQCKACHGDTGNSQLENIPSIAAQPEFFLLNQLVLMREGVRKIEAMADAVKGLQDAEIQALATWFAKQKPERAPETLDPELVKRGAALSQKMRCESCHGAEFQGETQIPRIAGQRIDYMLDVMKAFRDNKREGADTNMTAAVFGASDDDLKALAHYAASR
ncbi:MAG: c-type cytochrome [Alphaproteobacteria bacterium]|nr:c-type cytochrome [Alphaproteobacteria bacterium]